MNLYEDLALMVQYLNSMPPEVLARWVFSAQQTPDSLLQLKETMNCQVDYKPLSNPARAKNKRSLLLHVAASGKTKQQSMKRARQLHRQAVCPLLRTDVVLGRYAFGTASATLDPKHKKMLLGKAYALILAMLTR